MSQHQQPDVSLVLPMFNEEQAVATTLRQLLDLFATTLAHYSFEIIVVDDGSSDKSAEQVRQIDSTHIRLVQHPYNIGNGAAVKTGIRQAKGEYILLMDADGQHQPEDIPRLLEHAETYDMVVGARTNESDTAVHRDLANTVYNRLASYICGRPIDDLTSGFRLIRAELAKSLVYLLPNTFSYPSTMTLAVVRGGFSLKYIPIAARKRVGKSKINLLVDGSRFLTIILRIAVFFAPLKVFIPVSLFFFLSGFSWYVYRVFFVGTGFPPISSLFMTTAVIIFLIGLVSEQITYLRYGKE
jgi:glycosyltransferase involved in cell wall biosynthesis